MNLRLIFFLGICAMTLHFSIRVGRDLFHYLALQKKTTALISQWETVEIGERVALKADYTFEAQGKTCRSSYLFSPPYHLNEGAAFSALKQKAKESWTVWYNPKNPSTSALEKAFPTSLLIRTLICYGVIVYFLLLNRRLAVL